MSSNPARQHHPTSLHERIIQFSDQYYLVCLQVDQSIKRGALAQHQLAFPHQHDSYHAFELNSTIGHTRPNTRDIMVKTIVKEEPRDEPQHGPKRSPQPIVAANDLLMRTIFDLVDSRADLVNGMLACKDLFNIPAGLLKSTTEEEMARVWARGCGVVSEGF